MFRTYANYRNYIIHFRPFTGDHITIYIYTYIYIMIKDNILIPLEPIPEEAVLFEIKKKFLSCRKCFDIITDDKVIERCDTCNDVWCCSNNNTSKKYFETTFDLCNDCVKNIVPEQSRRKHRINIRPYNIFTK